MNFKTMKTLAVTGASVLALTAGMNTAHAQAVQTTITTTFSTGAGLATATTSNMDFGTWVISVAGADNFTLVLPADITGAAGAVTCGGRTGTSVCTQLVAPATTGVVTVTSPIISQVQIQGNVTPNFTDANLSLGSLTFDDATGASTAIPTAFNGTDLVDITAPSTPEAVGIGGTLTITGTPATATTFTSATVVIDFQY